VTATATPGAPDAGADGIAAPLILEASAWPNPATGDHWGLAFKLSGPADRLTVTVFTKAEVAAARLELNGPFGGGWNRARFPAPGLPQGLYYLSLRAGKGAQTGPPGGVLRVFVLP
jgi:hypothetical protein